MKKIILAAVAVMAFGFANAQEGQFKLGAHVGLPMGDFKDAYSLNVGADVAYLWNVADGFKVGATTGYSAYLGKTTSINLGFGSVETKTTTASFVPVAATAQFSVADNLFLGADLGYAVNVGKGDGNGGVYYQPKFGFQTDKVEVYLGYKGISLERGSFSSLNVGMNFKF